MDHFLMTAALLSAPFEGEIMLAAVFAAISQGSVRHLNTPLKPNALAPDGVFPDGMRRAVTVASIARSLTLPRETTRRYVRRLVEMGYCEQVGARGVLVPSAVLKSPAISELAKAHAAMLKDVVERFDSEAD